MQNHRTTGLNSNQFATLITALNKNLLWNKPATRPRALTLNQALKITLIYLRHNLTEEVLAEAFGVSQPTISKNHPPHRRRTVKAKRAESPRARNSPEYPRLTGNRRHFDSGVELVFTGGGTLFSGKHQRVGFNHQVICTLNGKLLAITDPVPGARYDVHAFRFHRLERFLDESTLADKGYIGLGLLTPTKRKPGVRMRAEVRENNRHVNRLRSVVERVIVQVKTWRVLHSGFRCPLSFLWSGVLGGAGVDFFRVYEPL